MTHNLSLFLMQRFTFLKIYAMQRAFETNYLSYINKEENLRCMLFKTYHGKLEKHLYSVLLNIFYSDKDNEYYVRLYSY